MKKLLLLGSQHGNEVLGINLYTYISDRYPELLEHVDYLCGNPEAYDKHVRFIETDMNRSYNMGSASLEEKRADEILSLINAKPYDYVLDIHTTTADMRGTFITTALRPENTAIIQASSIDTIVVMSDTIAEHSLIGNVPSSVCVEYNEDAAKVTETLESLAQFVCNLVHETTVAPIKRNIYEVDGFIGLDEPTDGIHNFERTPSGYYPVLFGEVNYTKHHGFKSSSVFVQEI